MRIPGCSKSGALGATLLALAAFQSQPARSQVDLSGTWLNWVDQDNKIRFPGPDPDTFVGIPLNQAARDAALAYSPQNIDELQRQCDPWPVHYILLGPMPIEIWATKRIDGSVLAWNLGGSVDQDPTTIWMDGRAPPGPQSVNTPTGFTSGHWLGDTLVATTVHIQDGFLYRNGVPNSDREVFTMFISRHDNFLTITGVVHDPVYLTAPYVLTAIYSSDPHYENGIPASRNSTCAPEEQLSNESEGHIPSYLTPPPDSVLTATQRYGIPQDAALGGAQTMYPEYSKALRKTYKRPGYCTTDCCGSMGPDGKSNMDFNVKVLKCNQTLQ